MPAFFILTSNKSSKNVNEQEQAKPYHVNEMPVPSNRFKCKMVVFAEMTLRATEPHYRQHYGAERNVHAVEAGQHEEGGTVNARA